MVCIHCQHDTQVFNSRHTRRSNQVWRRRRCPNCGATFSSYETLDFATSLRVQTADGRLMPLSRDRLFLSLYNSLRHRPRALDDAAALSSTVLTKVIQRAISGVVDSRTITQTVIVALSRFDKVARTHYQAFHAD